ncbi:MAG: host attachment protein [Hydrococcus sp. C42_A2020_068]|uniref:host attachment protein n=1 Tax=Pleurocapsa sp. PCC 7327 TaxID=118163 RepID=UPI00029FB264|nr:host attachment protein [Pleurocapsa sp. PCC 7327]AFY75788.1 Protein required for attachment to host cells [Pleurocapsa sp. PCC 7327]MBF2020435.1 host attachment protein [Hydrococcus sp. C42_A2020_068]
MNQSVVAVIDGTKARFFILEQAEVPEYQSGPNLVEKDSLANTANELHGKDLWSTTKTGRNRGAAGQAHGYDDHRQNHLNEFERSFAKEIVNKIVELTQAYHAQKLLLVAEPQILGLLREAIAPHLPKHLKIQELAKDLCKLKPLELHQYLADKELLPARKIVSR